MKIRQDKLSLDQTRQEEVIVNRANNDDDDQRSIPIIRMMHYNPSQHEVSASEEKKVEYTLLCDVSYEWIIAWLQSVKLQGDRGQ